MQLTEKQIKNFWSKVNKTDSCWNWVGSECRGYGKVNLNTKTYLTHRISLSILGLLDKPRTGSKGAKGILVLHKCDNRKCVNPAHLLTGTQKDNMHDAKLKGRKWYGEMSGENNPRAKLTNKDVKKIRSLMGSMPNKQIASLYKINPSQVYCIRTGITWANI